MRKKRKGIEEKLAEIEESNNHANVKSGNGEIKAIMFDLGNVLVPYRINEAMRTFYRVFKRKKIQKDDMKDFLASEKTGKLRLMREYEKGMSREEFFNEIGRMYRVPFSQRIGKMAERATYRFFKPIDTEVENMIKQLRKDYSIAAISNIVKPHREYVLKRYPVQDLFDYLFFSCDIGMRKPDTKIYNFALEKMHVKPNEALFIDDYKKNVDAAATLGINSIHFSSAADLRERLNNFNIHTE